MTFFINFSYISALIFKSLKCKMKIPSAISPSYPLLSDSWPFYFSFLSLELLYLFLHETIKMTRWIKVEHQHVEISLVRMFYRKKSINIMKSVNVAQHEPNTRNMFVIYLPRIITFMSSCSLWIARSLA